MSETDQRLHKINHIKKVYGDPNKTDEDIDKLEKQFEKDEPSCGKQQMNQIISRKCRCMEVQVHLSMLILSRTMIWDEDAEALRMSNIHVNHNNHTKSVAMEIINNMAFDPLELNKPNKNDNQKFASDIEIYWTLWNKVRYTGCGICVPL